MQTKPRILVTGAAGHTGAVVVDDLLKAGFPVRAFVRQHDTRSAALEQAGAEIFVGDLFDFRDVRAAMNDVQRAYHCPPFAMNLLHGAMVFALAAEDAKLEVVALLSQWLPHASDPSVVTREHWLANNIYRWMPSVDVIHINPGWFAFVYMLGLPSIVHLGMMVGPFGNAQNAPPSNEDIGHVAAAVLVDPADHLGKSYRPTGPKLMTPDEMASDMGKALGRKVKYQDASVKMFTKAALAQGFPLFEIAHVAHYSAASKSGAFSSGAPTDHVEQVTGKPAEPFIDTARRYFANPKLIYHSLETGTKLGAFAFLARMLMTRAPDLGAYERSLGYPLLKNPKMASENPDWVAAAQNQQLHLLSGVENMR